MKISQAESKLKIALIKEKPNCTFITSYERDNESDLDFAQARYYNKNHGRFTSPDEPFLDQFEDNPQSWNLYLYVRNNPLNLVDPFGTKAGCPPGSSDGCYEREGKYYHKDENGNEIEHDPTPIKVETMIKGQRSGFRNQFERGFHNLGRWLRHLFGPKNPPNQPTIPAPPSQPRGGNQTSQPNQVYGPPSPPSPPVSLRNQILQGRKVRGRFPKTANPNEILYRTDSNGKITFYQTYDSSGRPIQRVDLVGPSHGGIPTPHVREYNLNVNQSGQSFINPGIVRPANPSEIP